MLLILKKIRLKYVLNEYNAISIKIEDKHVVKKLKEMIIKEEIDVLLGNGVRKETDLIKGKFVDKSNEDAIMNKDIVYTSTIQAGQSIIDNVLHILIQTLSIITHQ